MQKFDDAEMYFLDFTSELPNEAGGIPIGLYWVWAAGAGLVDEALAKDIAARRERGQSAADILFDLADGKLTTDELNEEGAAFTEAYYATSYIADYRRCFRITDDSGDALCSVPDTPASSTRLKPFLHERLVAWRAKPRVDTPKPAKPTAADIYAFFERELFPELVADGYTLVPEGRGMMRAQRRHGVIEQKLLYMASDYRESAGFALFVYLGAERVREAWLSLCDAQLRASPPPAYSADVRNMPDIHADDFSLSHVTATLSPYYKSIPEGFDQQGRIALAHYRDWVRPRMDALRTVAELGKQVTYEGQVVRLRQKLGYMMGPEVLARIVLLSVYTNRFYGGEGPELVKQLHIQIQRNINRKPEDFPTIADVDALIAALKDRDVERRVKAMLDA